MEGWKPSYNERKFCCTNEFKQASVHSMIEQEHCFQVSGEVSGGTVGAQIVEEILLVARKPMQVGVVIQPSPSRESCPAS